MSPHAAESSHQTSDPCETDSGQPRTAEHGEQPRPPPKPDLTGTNHYRRLQRRAALLVPSRSDTPPVPPALRDIGQRHAPPGPALTLSRAPAAAGDDGLPAPRIPHVPGPGTVDHGRERHHHRVISWSRSGIAAESLVHGDLLCQDRPRFSGSTTGWQGPPPASTSTTTREPPARTSSSPGAAVAAGRGRPSTSPTRRPDRPSSRWPSRVPPTSMPRSLRRA